MSPSWTSKACGLADCSLGEDCTALSHSASHPTHPLTPPPISTPTPQGLPTSRLHASNGADAVVAWNASGLTANIVWLGSEERVRGGRPRLTV